MTRAEKIKMFKEKKAFIANISKAFESRPAGSSIESVRYEVYNKWIPDHNVDYFAEYIVVTFVGGGRSVKIVNGNSNTANFRAIGTLLDGGYYDEVADFESILARGFDEVILED
jgi:hypothetical protein